MSTEEIIAPSCQGCSKSIEEGAVVAFGEALFHVNCFVCAKCKERVNNQTNLLLLDDGRPVCDNCSYNCVLCHQVIRDEAIMTGDKAYHTECFKCSSCKNKIEDLIFTQTTKGIFCTKCYELRKEEKMRRKNNSNNNHIKSESKQLPLPTPTRSRNNSFDKNNNTTTKNTQPSDFSVSLDFFNSDSSELANLSDSLGANLSLNFDSSRTSYVEDISPTQTRINRASEILQSSLRTSSLKNISFDKDIVEKDVSDTDKLKQELEETRSRLKEIETNYNLLQDASQQALDEFTKVKEDFAKEAVVKQQQELIITALLRKNGGMLSKQNITKAAQLRVEIDHSCHELIKYRDELTIMTDQQTEKQLKNFIHGNETLLKSQIKALKSERDVLKTETKELRASRDDVIHEITLLNGKNAELTNMNNELSMRAIEKEEAASTSNSVMVQPSSSTLSVSHSTDSSSSLSLVTTRSRKISDASSIICKVSTRNSFIADQTPKLFRIKKKGSTMFSKFSGSSNGATTKTSVKPEPSISSKSSIYNGGSNSSLQNLANNSSSYDLNNLSGSLGKSSKSKLGMESSLSLHQIPTTNQSGSHSFQPTSFLRPVKCGVCGDKIWGRSEYRCDGCGFSSHSRCLTKVPQQCLAATRSSLDLLSSTSTLSPESDDGTCKQLASMFGMDMSERVKIENRQVPLLVEECIKAVETRGLDFEGIYRKSGGAAQIRAIQTSFDQGEKIDLCDEDEYNDIGSITSVLKQYFRELPNPLLTFEAYDAFIEVSTMANDHKKIDAFKNIIAKLPTAHRQTMSLLFNHLAKIYQHCDTNRMSIKNLTMVFAPTLMRHNDASKDFLDMSYKNAAVEFILTNTSELFDS